MLVLLWSSAHYIPGLCLTPPGVIPQPGHSPWTIFDYIWSGINHAISPWVLAKTMQFGQTFCHILFSIVTTDPDLGPVFLSKTDLSDAYMHIWMCIKDVPTLTFNVPAHTCDK
eukprot:3229127-Ditylum_brightwellii.AAC.1